MPNDYRYEDVLSGFVKRLMEMKATGNLVSSDEPSLMETARGFAHELEEEDSKAKYCAKCGTLAIYAGDCENCERMGFTTDSFFPPDWELPDVKISELPPTVKRLHELLTKARLATARAMEFYNEMYGAQDEGVEKLHATIEGLAVENSQLKELLATSNDLISMEKGDLQAKVDELEAKLKKSKADCTKAGGDYWYAEGEKEELEEKIKVLNKKLSRANMLATDSGLIVKKIKEVFVDSEVEPEGFSLIEAVKQLKGFVDRAKEIVICVEEGTHAYDCSATKGKPMNTPRGSCTCLSVRASQLTAVWPQFS